MSMCLERQHPWGGFACTLRPDHEGDHAAEGRINRSTGRAAVLATWPRASAEVAATSDVEIERRVRWKRVRPGHYAGRVDGHQTYAMTKVANRWFLFTHPGGGMLGSAATVPEAKELAEQLYAMKLQSA